MNNLLKLLELFPTEPWSVYHLCSNPGMPLELLLTMPDVDYYALTHRYIEHPEVIYNNPEVPWDMSALCWVHIHIPLLERYVDKIDFGFLCLVNFTLTPDIITNNPQLPWSIEKYHENRVVDPALINQYPNFPWDYSKLATKYDVTVDVFQLYVNKNLDIADVNLDRTVNDPERLMSGTIIGSKGIPIELVRLYVPKIDKPIFIRPNSDITWDTVKEFPDAKWDIVGLVNMLDRHGMYAEIEYVLNNTHTMRDVITYNCFSMNVPGIRMGSSYDFTFMSGISIEFILTHDFPWDWENVMQRSDLQWSDVVKYELYKKHNPSRNPNLTYEIIAKNEFGIEWDFHRLSMNTFNVPH